MGWCSAGACLDACTTAHRARRRCACVLVVDRNYVPLQPRLNTDARRGTTRDTDARRQTTASKPANGRTHHLVRSTADARRESATATTRPPPRSRPAVPGSLRPLLRVSTHSQTAVSHVVSRHATATPEVARTRMRKVSYLAYAVHDLENAFELCCTC